MFYQGLYCSKNFPLPEKTGKTLKFKFSMNRMCTLDTFATLHALYKTSSTFWQIKWLNYFF